MRSLYCLVLILTCFVPPSIAHNENDHYYRWQITTSPSCGAQSASPTQTCAEGCANCSPNNSPCYSNDPADGTNFSCLNKNDAPLTWGTKVVEHCSPGQHYDNDLKQCVDPCPPCHTRNPQTQACEFVCEGEEVCNESNQCEVPLQCEPGQTTFTIGNTTTCIDQFEDPDHCNDVAGYASDIHGNEHQICNDDKNACEAEGGTYGLVDDRPTCLPSDYGDDIPTCETGSINVIDGEGTGFACNPVSPTDDIDNPDTPNSNPTNEKDTDGDGVPDSEDDDIDGDGTPNGSDSDADGDGIPNVDDPTPYGEEESSVSGGGSCGSRPTCSGDAIQCASLYQLWSLRCESQDDDAVSGGTGCDAAPSCTGNAVMCAINEQVWRSRCESFIESQAELDSLTAGLDAGSLYSSGTDLTAELSGIFASGTPGGACPADYPLSIMGTTISVSYGPFCSFAVLINPLVLILFSLFALRIVWSAF